MSADELRIAGEGAPPIELISVRIPEAVRMTGLSRSRIYQLIASGEIEAAKVGRATVVLVASLKTFLRANRKQPRVKG
jgi:excisionase family DNA binding protein